MESSFSEAPIVSSDERMKEFQVSLDSTEKDLPNKVSDDFLEQQQVVEKTNFLLSRMGFGERTFEDFEDLVASVSSMSVALYEKLFQFRLENIIRVPNGLIDYEKNAQLVVDALAGALLDASFETEMTGKALCQGETKSISQLINMFNQIYDILYANQPFSEEESSFITPNTKEPLTKTTKPSSMYTTTAKKKTSTTTKRPPNNHLKTKLNSSKKKNTASVQQTPPALALKREAYLREQRLKNAGLSSQRTTSKTLAKAQQKTNKKTIQDIVQRAEKVLETTRNSGNSRNSSSSSSILYLEEEQEEEEEEEEEELLATQKYGRFVPVPMEKEEEEDERNKIEEEKEKDQREKFFAGVSSVSFNGTSDEEEDPLARTYQELQCLQLQEEEEEDDENTNHDLLNKSFGSALKHVKEKTTTTAASTKATTTKNKHQQQKSVSAPTTPVKKQPPLPLPLPLPRQQQQQQQQQQQKEQQQSTKKKKKSLYPLSSSSMTPIVSIGGMNSTRCKTTNESMKQFQTRYKLLLKDHLQALRLEEKRQLKQAQRSFLVQEHEFQMEKIRAKRLAQDLKLEKLSIGFKQRQEEENHLRSIMKQMLFLEKQMLIEENQLTNNLIQKINEKQQQKQKSMEFFYQTQMDLIKEENFKILKERQILSKAKQVASKKYIQELKEKHFIKLQKLFEQQKQLMTLQDKKTNVNVTTINNSTANRNPMKKNTVHITNLTKKNNLTKTNNQTTHKQQIKMRIV